MASATPESSALDRNTSPIAYDLGSGLAGGESIARTANKSQLSGWRLAFVTTGLCLSVFLSALDITIVSTALNTISDDLGSFQQSSWIVSSYLVSYFSFLIIWAKVSDLLGRRFMLLIAIVLFLAFSGACGGAQSTTEIIVFRALQGTGGAGIFSMVPIIVAEMVSKEKYGMYNGIVSLAIGFSFLLGPLLGGAISDGTTWRWIFWVNIPIGLTAFILILVAMPSNFPFEGSSQSVQLSISLTEIEGRVDYLGFLLLLAASTLLIIALEEAGLSFSWGSAVVITLIVLSVTLLCAFLFWQRFLFTSASKREAVIPWKFLQHRVLMGTYLNAFLSGVPFVTVVIELPQRFQSVVGNTALTAGVHILPFTLSIALGSALTGALTAKGRVPPLVVLTMATALQILGIGLIYATPLATSIQGKFYGFQALAGLGVGLSLTTLLNIVPFIVQPNELAVALGGVTQLRILGGAVGLSIATNILNNTVKSSLTQRLTTQAIQNVLEDVSFIQTLSPDTQSVIHAAFSRGYQIQDSMLLGFCVAEILSLVLTWEWPMRRLL